MTATSAPASARETNSSAIASAVALLSPQSARAADVGVQLSGGTLGLGLQAGFGISERWNGRVGFNTFEVGEDFEEGGIDYSADLELQTFHALADWHPFRGGFRISGGLMSNGNEITGDAEVEGGDQVGNTTVPPGRGGRIGATIDFDSTAPYLGIGWGRALGSRTGLSFTADVGVLFQGEPNVDLRKEQGLPDVSEQDVEDEEADVEDELSDFDVYPVVSVGVVYTF